MPTKEGQAWGEQLDAVARELDRRGFPALLYNSGGGLMVITLYPDGVDFRTSEGQYKYTVMVGNGGEDQEPWGLDRFDANGEHVESEDLRVSADATSDQIADAIMQLDRAPRTTAS